MQISYLIAEGFSGFGRAKLSMFAAIFTICVSLLLLSFFSILLINANRVVETLRDKVEMEAFIGDYQSRDDINALKLQLEAIDGIREVRFVSKEEAAAIFKQEFGEDINKVLNFNPLPASYKIFLKDGFKTARQAEIVFQRVRLLKGVEDVIYRKQLLEMLDQRAMLFLWITLGVGLCIALASVILVANTIRLAIYAKRKIIQTMKLIGATRRFIRVPFIIEGLVQGLLGGVLAAGVVYLLFHALGDWATLQLTEFVQVDPMWYVIILIAGCVLGGLGSLISVRRFISESVVT
jgi:cell division transport system permease protein